MYKISAKSNNPQLSYCDSTISNFSAVCAVLDLTESRFQLSAASEDPYCTSVTNFNKFGQCKAELFDNSTNFPRPFLGERFIYQSLVDLTKPNLGRTIIGAPNEFFRFHMCCFVSKPARPKASGIENRGQMLDCKN